MLLSRFPSFFDILLFGFLLFVNYAVWINTEIYNKFINYFIEMSEKSDFVNLGEWKELIGSPHFIWFPRTVFLIALFVHSYFIYY